MYMQVGCTLLSKFFPLLQRVAYSKQTSQNARRELIFMEKKREIGIRSSPENAASFSGMQNSQERDVWAVIALSLQLLAPRQYSISWWEPVTAGCSKFWPGVPKSDYLMVVLRLFCGDYWRLMIECWSFKEPNRKRQSCLTFGDTCALSRLLERVVQNYLLKSQYSSTKEDFRSAWPNCATSATWSCNEWLCLCSGTWTFRCRWQPPDHRFIGSWGYGVTESWNRRVIET